jgi:glutaredoxin
MQIDLYYRRTCPFSAKVLDFISTQEIDERIVKHEIELDHSAKEKLIQRLGKPTVPCLIVKGRKTPILEPDQIIEWLTTNVLRKYTYAA